LLGVFRSIGLPKFLTFPRKTGNVKDTSLGGFEKGGKKESLTQLMEGDHN
jgi:hypothetical protein